MNIRRTFLSLMLIGLLALIPACSSDDGGTGPGETPADVGTVSGVVSSGRAPLEGVTVSIGSQDTVTNQDGWFALTDVPAQQDAVVEFVLADFMSAFRRVDVTTNQTSHLPNVSLIPTETVLLSAAAGGEAATGDGDGSATFPAGAFETAAGDPYDGNVEIEITAALPDDADFFEVFPGAFEGETAGGETVPFVSYGFMGVNPFTEGRGEPLQLADGVSAELSIRVSEETARAAPDTIPMWWFDEDRGVWVEEGRAIKVGNEFVTEVEHFTIWNWDLPVTEICMVSGQVQDQDGDPVPDARVFSQGVGCTFADETMTDAGGNFTIRSIKECSGEFWAMKGTLASAPLGDDIGAEDTQDLPEPLVLDVPAFSITLVWGLDPDDLDSHLLIPMTWDTQYDYYHIYYSNMGWIGGDPYTALNTDDTSSFGPEIITGTRLYPGTYSYFVHHYSGLGTIASSPTSVTLEVGNYYRTWTGSSASGGFHDGGVYIEDSTYYEDYWHVFDMVVDAQGNVSVQSVNEAVVSSDDEDGPWNGWGVDISEYGPGRRGNAKP